MRKHQEQIIPQNRKKKSRFSLLSAMRIGLQILFFVWMPALYIGAFSGLQEIFTALITGTFSLSLLWPDLIAFAVIVPLTILAGRFFCGWMCAFGSLTDWIFRIFSRWTKNKIRLSRKADSIFKSVKYIVLAALLVLGWLAASLSLSAMSPWDAFGMLFTVGAVPAVLFVLQSMLPGFVLLVLILIASAFVERFFCRYLCPMGALFAWTSESRFIYIDKPRDGCGKCQVCTKNCAMGIPLNQMDKVKSGECIGCMKCVEVCPRKNVKVRAGTTLIHPAAITAAMTVLIIGLFLFTTALTNAAAQSLSTAAAGSSAASSSASAASGTTAASGSGSVSGTVGTTSAAAASESAATAAATAPASAATAATAAPTTAATAASATAAATAAPTTAATTAAGLYKDGTYTGSGTGFRGTTTIEVTVSGGQISNISVVSYQDDAQYFNKAYSTISANAVAAQSAAVDVVSHATYSSKGIIGAINDALAQAKN